LANRNASPFLIGKLMSHTQPGTTAKYMHAADEALRATANDFANVLRTPKKQPQSA
jgi:hypothetical protein